MGEHFDKAVSGWGEDMPDWIRALASACDATSQRIVSERIKYSKAVVSLVVKGTYSGDLTAVETAVNARLMDAKIDCPVADEIPLAACLKNQVPPARYTNNEQIKFAQVCPTCPNYQNGGK